MESAGRTSTTALTQRGGLVIVRQAGFRRQPVLIEGAVHWCRSRGITCSVIDRDDFDACAWGLPPDSIRAFYLPIAESYEPIRLIGGRYPVILDFDANGSSDITTLDLGQVRYAVRNAFGMRVRANRAPTFQVPYLHRPAPAADDEIRDVVIFDVKPFHSMPGQAAVLALIAGIADDYARACAIAGRRIYFYFSSFMPPQVFMEAIDAFHVEPAIRGVHRNSLRDMADAILSPAVGMADYARILRRCRLFVTEHGDIADIDLVQVGSLGIPILLYQRLPFFRTAGISLQTLDGAAAIDVRMRSLLERAERHRVRPEWGFQRIFSTERVEPWAFDVLENCFMKSWDLLWDWVETGMGDPNVNAAMSTDHPWGLGLTEDSEC